MRTLLYLLEKEFKQFFRDPFMPRMVIVFPVIIMLVIPYVANMDFKDINICIIDNDTSPLSRQIVNRIAHSSYFRLQDTASSLTQAMQEMDKDKIDIVLEIPADFEKNLTTQAIPQMSITANAVNASKASAGSGYLAQILASSVNDFYTNTGRAVPTPPITVKNMYNPTENYRHFMIPALLVMLIIIVCGALPALNIVKEKENGTIEQMNVTPVSKITFTLSKLIPYWIMGLFILSIALAIAWLLFGLVPVGPLWIVYAIALLFTFAISSFGLIISNFSSTMQQAMFVMFFFIMIFILMSGLLTPIESMPQWAQEITRFIPPRYFIDAMRCVYLKGSGPSDVYPDFLWLTGFTVFLTFIAIISYKKQA